MHDTIIRGATVIDGTKAPRYAADLAIDGDRIAAIGDLAAATARREIDGTGFVLAPGFIDVHTHDDLLLLADPAMPAKASQGVTTVVVGNCGISLSPLLPQGAPPPPLDLIGARDDFRYAAFADYLAALDAKPAALNAAALIGHSTLRVGAMDRLDRPATDAEIAVMRERADAALAAGAFGISTGLFYMVANAATTEEVIGVCAPLKTRGGLYVTHMRDEGAQVLDSLDETFRIGRETGAAGAVVSHHKVSGKSNYGRSVDTLAAIAQAMGRQSVGLDAYPYSASSTILRTDMIDRAERTLVSWSKARPDMAGLDLDEAARRMGLDRLAAANALQPAGAIYFMMAEDDVRRILAFPPTMIGSDGLPHDRHPHPRLWGTFPRVLGHYSRDVGLFSLEEAVHKMTGLTAARFAIADRGRIAVGAFADLVLFDPATVIDAATFDRPMTPSIGIHQVLVNGEPVWREGAPTGARPGRALRRAA